MDEIKRLVFVVVALGSLIFWMPDANAGYWINGVYVAKGVECDGTAQVKNINNNQVSLTCSIAPPVNQPFDVILFCQNHGGHIGTGRAFTPEVTFTNALATGTVVPSDKGKVIFTAISNAAGVAQTSQQCDADPACQVLRQLCINLNGNDSSWVPVDVVPVAMLATVATYFCDNDGSHICPCDPSITGLTDVHRCATSLGGGNPPWSFDWNQTGGQLVPAGLQKSSCVLPNPETYVFGERRPYTCTVIP